MRMVSFLGGCAVVLASTVAHAAVPDVITYAGSLQQNGAAVNGPVTAVFTLFDDATAGTSRYSQTEPSLVVVDGALVADLGPIDDSVLALGTLFLEVSINGETLSPRVPLNAVPYARLAKSAEDLNGLTAADIAALNSADPNGGLADNAGAFSIADDGVTSGKIQDGTITGDDVADTSIPFSKLDLSGHLVPVFLVPQGVDFCPGFTPGQLTLTPVCQSIPKTENGCISLQPLPTGCTCGSNGATQSFATCPFSLLGELVR